MRQVFILGISLFCAALVASCDRQVTPVLYVRNSSPIAVNIKFSGTNNSTIERLQPGNELKLDVTTKSSSKKDFVCCPCELTSFEITPMNTNRVLVKDVNEKANWVARDRENVDGGREFACELVLYPHDFK